MQSVSDTAESRPAADKFVIESLRMPRPKMPHRNAILQSCKEWSGWNAHVPEVVPREGLET